MKSFIVIADTQKDLYNLLNGIDCVPNLPEGVTKLASNVWLCQPNKVSIHA